MQRGPANKKPAQNLKTSHLLNTALAVTAIGRHSIKGNLDSGLSAKGELKAEWAGRHLPKGFKYVVRSGDLARQNATGTLAAEARAQKKVFVPKDTAFGFKWIKNMKAEERLETRLGNAAFEAERKAGRVPVYVLADAEKLKAYKAQLAETEVLSKWFDRKIPISIIEDPAVVGNTILRNALSGTNFLMQTSPQRPFHLTITSTLMTPAIFKALDIDYRNIKPKKPNARSPPKKGEGFKETEAVLFFHLPDGKIVLAFRGRKFDVTKKIERILNM